MKDKSSTPTSSYRHLAIVLDGSLIARFFLLLQQGVAIRRRVGCSIDAFLRQELGAAPDTIEKIQSIMLDGRPVDDIGSSLIHDGSVLALSAAMPGLVGATMRRGGAYSAFRSAITYHETGNACMPGEGWVSIKIFNLLMAELGPGLLRKGIFVNASALTEYLNSRSREFRQGCSITLDGKPIDITTFEGNTVLAGEERVFLTVVRSSVSA
jgi:hypothetical protein